MTRPAHRDQTIIDKRQDANWHNTLPLQHSKSSAILICSREQMLWKICPKGASRLGLLGGGSLCNLEEFNVQICSHFMDPCSFIALLFVDFDGTVPHICLKAIRGYPFHHFEAFTESLLLPVLRTRTAEFWFEFDVFLISIALRMPVFSSGMPCR